MSTQTTESEPSMIVSLLSKSDPSKADTTGLVTLYIFVGLAILGMVFSSYEPSMRDLTILLVALILLSLGIWYLIYSVQLYKQFTKKDNSIMARAYERLLTAIGN